MELKRASGHDLRILQQEAVERLAVQAGRLDVRRDGSVLMDENTKLLAVFKVDNGFRKQGRSDGVLRNAGRDLIEAKRAEHVPGRHLSGVVVAGQSTGGVLVPLIASLGHVQLRLPSCSSPVIQISNLVAGLVAVVVVAFGKQLVQFGDEGLVAVLEGDEAGNVLRHKKGVLKRQPLGDVAGGLARLKGRHPAAVGVATTRKTGLWVHHVAPVRTALAEGCLVVRLAKCMSQFGEHKVVVGVLQSARNLLALVHRIQHWIFERNVAVLEVGVECASSLAIYILIARGR